MLKEESTKSDKKIVRPRGEPRVRSRRKDNRTAEQRDAEVRLARTLQSAEFDKQEEIAEVIDVKSLEKVVSQESLSSSSFVPCLEEILEKVEDFSEESSGESDEETRAIVFCDDGVFVSDNVEPFSEHLPYREWCSVNAIDISTVEYLCELSDKYDAVCDPVEYPEGEGGNHVLVGGMRRRGNKKKKKGAKKKAAGSNSRVYRTVIPVGSQNRGMIAPESMSVELTYSENVFDYTNVGANYLIARWRLNSAYDPNPLLLTGGISGFSEWAALYRRYLVEHVRVTISFVNKEAFPVTVCFLPTDFDVSSVITSQQQLIDLCENAYATPMKDMSPTGGLDKVTLESRLNLARVSGFVGVYRNSDQYSALVNTSPTILIYGNMLLLPDKNFTTQGIYARVKIQMRVLFTQRQPVFG